MFLLITQAGIPSEQLKIALEPEAASVWCQTITNTSAISALGTTGSAYMVVDLGGKQLVFRGK